MRIRLGAGALAALLSSSSVVVAACGSSSHAKTSGTVDPNAPTLDVTAKSFSFTPSQITVKAGTTETFVLHVKDLSHDFTVKELDVHFGGGPGDTAKKTVTFDKPG